MSRPGQGLEVGDSLSIDSAADHPALGAIAEARGKHAVILYFLRAFT